MTRQPTLFISHGAPTYALEPGISGAQLRWAAERLTRPSAVLIVSPHWMTPEPRVAVTGMPTTIHDFGGFDAALYDLRYPAAGRPDLAEQTIRLLRDAGWNAQPDSRWGLDHGAWVPLLHMYPSADVPVFQVSMPRQLDAEAALDYGGALAPLADDGVLIVGSGSLTHNLSEFLRADASEERYVPEFVAWIREAALAGDRKLLARALADAPHARRAHPTSEHFLPLLVAAGAAQDILPITVLPGGITHGMLSMESYVFGANLEKDEQIPLTDSRLVNSKGRH